MIRTLRTLSVLCLLTVSAGAQLVADFSANVVAGTNPLTVQFSDGTTGGTPQAWLWDFGDGSLAQTKNPQHTYTAPGVYDVKLTVGSTTQGSDMELKVGFISVAPAVNDASFSASATQGTNPFPVQFTDTSTGPITGWLWDFGDGSTSTEQNPSHVYSVTGGTTAYTVSLTTFVADQADTEVAVDLITVDPALLVPSFSVDVTSGIQPLEVQFTDTSTGPIDSWSWDLGNGQTSSLQNPSKTFFTGATPSSFDITLTVSVGDQVAILTLPDLITVEPAPAVLNFSQDVVQGVGDVTVSFSNLTTGYDFLFWSWNFGDGTSVSNAQDPTHTFFASEPTTFDVTLTASVGQQVEVLSRTAAVTVAPGVFGPRRELDTPTLTGGDTLVGSADLDGDGDRDLLALSLQDGGLRWLGSQGGGAFAAGQPVGQSPYGISFLPRGLCLDDIDGDGDVDCLVGAETQLGIFATGELILARNLGGGLFAPQTVQVATDTTAQLLRLADLDGDGDQDVLASDASLFFTGGRVWWHENLDGLGALGPDQPIASVGVAKGLEPGDLDADGDLDLVVGEVTVTSNWERRLVWIENLDGLGGSWSEHELLLSLHDDDLPADVAVADLDADGDLDLIDAGAGLRWWPNDGSGGFPAGQLLIDDSDRLATPLAVDVDGDGDLDLMASDEAGSAWVEHLDGAGSFSSRRTVALGAPGDEGALPAALEDLDGDGDLDVLAFRAAISTSGGSGWVENVLTVPEWEDLGQPLAGTAGEPMLSGSGALAPGETFSLALRDALAGSVATLVVGVVDLSLPFKGGVMVPRPDLLITLPVDANGTRVLLEQWPAGIAAGAPILVQHWIVDGAGPVGLSASNALGTLTQD